MALGHLKLRSTEATAAAITSRFLAFVGALWLSGCSTTPSALPPLAVPFPERKAIARHAGDYARFAAFWTGSLPAKTLDPLSPLAPSDARLIAVDGAEKMLDRQLRTILVTFEEWCKDSQGSAWPRGEDMASPGKAFAVCELNASRDKVAALRVTTLGVADDPRKRTLLIEHWYPPDLARYADEWRMQLSRQANAARRAAERRMADEKAEKHRLKEHEKVILDQMVATARHVRSTPACQRFERESNAILARFTIALNRVELRRMTSDLAVAFDECIGGKTPPSDALTEIYSFNFQNLQLLGDVWDAHLMPACKPGEVCNFHASASSPDAQRRMGELQSQYSSLRWLSPPDSTADITNRIPRFVLDR